MPVSISDVHSHLECQNAANKVECIACCATRGAIPMPIVKPWSKLQREQEYGFTVPGSCRSSSGAKSCRNSPAVAKSLRMSRASVHSAIKLEGQCCVLDGPRAKMILIEGRLEPWRARANKKRLSSLNDGNIGRKWGKSRAMKGQKFYIRQRQA
eukprot:1585280-Pleurochrysis_carterae.AAC.2